MYSYTEWKQDRNWLDKIYIYVYVELNYSYNCFIFILVTKKLFKFNTNSFGEAMLGKKFSL